jgi:hypothetical protein
VFNKTASSFCVFVLFCFVLFSGVGIKPRAWLYARKMLDHWFTSPTPQKTSSYHSLREHYWYLLPAGWALHPYLGIFPLISHQDTTPSSHAVSSA